MLSSTESSDNFAANSAAAANQMESTSNSTPLVATPMTPSSSTLNNATFPVPTTPEGTPGGLQNDATPLMSPTFLANTPHKRKSTDFYTLLKSPMPRGGGDDASPAKRSAIEIKKKTSAPSLSGTGSSELVAEVKHKTSASSLSGALSSTDYVFHDRVPRSDIKRISDNLRTRLNYANAKVVHGWSDKSLAEVQKQIEQDRNAKMMSQEEQSHYEEFWRMQKDELPRKFDRKAGSGTKTPPKRYSFPTASASASPINKASPRHRRQRSSTGNRLSLDAIASRHKHGTAERALYKALSPEVGRSPRASPRPPRIAPPPLPLNSNRLEQDAIASLMSLSSPVKYTHSGSPSPRRANPQPDTSSPLLPPLQKLPLSSGFVGYGSPGAPANPITSTTNVTAVHPLAPPVFGTVKRGEDDDTTEDETEDEGGSAGISRTLPPLRHTLGVPSSEPSNFGLAGLGLSSSSTGQQLRIAPLSRGSDTESISKRGH